MHLRISSARPDIALLAKSGSAMIARFMLTTSAYPPAMICSACSGSVMRPTVKTGMSTTSLMPAAVYTNEPSGTYIGAMIVSIDW